MVQSTPSRQQAGNGSLIGALSLAFKKTLQQLGNSLPARVVSYDRDTNKATVVPLIKVVTTEGALLDRPQLSEIPVFCLGGGGFVVNFPLVEGDLGWIKASDRDLSLFLQSYEASPPNTERLHSFEDAIFYPDVMRGYTINEEDDARMVIQSLNGTQRVSIGTDIIRVVGTTVHVEASSKITLEAPTIEILGNISHTGDQQTSGTIIADTEVIADGVELTSHLHSGVTSGGANTGEPV